VSFTTVAGHERLGQFWVEPGELGDLVPGSIVPVLAVDAIVHRAGICGPKALNLGRITAKKK